jgi:putative RNA 2'-phosphotransferase
MPDDLTRLSKFLALVLRHRAPDFGLAPDGEGFVPLSALLAVVRRTPELHADLPEILRLVEEGRPKRFEVRGELIRASYGHSLATEAPVAYPPATPPPLLYHGTNARALAAIRRHGLRPMRRQYVHLSTSVERAGTVGGRRTRQPVVLVVRAQAAHAAGITFHSPEPQHYLAAAIPPEFVTSPPATSGGHAAAAGRRARRAPCVRPDR